MTFCLLLAALATGCSLFPSSKSTEARLKTEVDRRAKEDPNLDGRSKPSESGGKAGAGQGSGARVRLDGSLSLGDTDNLALTPEQLATAISQLLDEDKLSSARELIRLYPDITAKLMVASNPPDLTREHRDWIADNYESIWAAESEAFVRLKQAYRSGTLNTVLSNQSEFLNRLQNNRPEEALELRLSRQVTDNELLQAEALRLEGMAYLVMEEHLAASQRLQAAAELLSSVQPVEANRILLLVGETERRAGNLEKWKSAWREAVTSHANILARHDLHDPAFWKQAAFLRPLKSDWPEEIVAQLRRKLVDEGMSYDGTESTESVVWANIGLQSLARHESQNAVLAFKKSEATAISLQLKQELQMMQAIGMIDGGQAGPASAILLRLSSQDGILSDRAKAVLAAMKLQNGSLAQGMNLLQTAIQSCTQWPAGERLRAQADYALSYLMRGKEQQGVQLLNQLHEQFLARDDFSQASQCLQNLATYFQQTKQSRKYRQTMARLESLENRTF